MSRPHRFDPTVLREYDIRGVIGRTLSVDDAYAVGRSFGTIVNRRGGRIVCVGLDGRLTSPDLEAATVDGLRDSAIEVWRVGIGPTPMLYYAASTLSADGGLMITGSHNPPDHNGFKMVLGKAAFFGVEIQKLGAIAAAGDYAGGVRGRVADKSILDGYVARLSAGLADGGAVDASRLTVAWDGGNGAVGSAMAALTRRLPGRHVLLNEKIDGRFPAHHPDPTVAKNLRQLQAAVAEHTADLGVAFDGDGDRIGAVDNLGRILWADQLLVFLAREVLGDRPGATVIADVKASQVLFDEIARAGGRALMWKSGHSLVKSKMAEIGAPLAGEMSGHIFFGPPFYGFDDALYAAVRLIGVIARSGSDLATLRDGLPPVVNTPEVRFPCSDDRKFAAVDEIKAMLKGTGARVIDIDGVRVQTEDGWWLLRASNTQDVLVARCEAHDDAALERLKESVMQALRAVAVAPPDW